METPSSSVLQSMTEAEKYAFVREVVRLFNINKVAFVPKAEFTANSITLDAGSSSDALADLQVFNDGNEYHIDEAAATPGIDLKVDFIAVDAFQRVAINGVYVGALTTHAVSIQLYDWINTAWVTFNTAHPRGVNIKEDLSFNVPDYKNYVGTGSDVGEVRVRFNHTMGGNASHDLYIEYVALYA